MSDCEAGSSPVGEERARWGEARREKVTPPFSIALQSRDRSSLGSGQRVVPGIGLGLSQYCTAKQRQKLTWFWAESSTRHRARAISVLHCKAETEAHLVLGRE